MMKKRLLSVLLACGMALTLLPAAAFAEDGEESPAPAESPVCVCETACEADSFNAACPVCGAEGVAVTDCGKYVAAEETPAPPQETEAAPAEPEEPQAEEPAEPAAPVEPTATQKAQDLINALPDAESITAENRADVEAQLTAIDEAKSALTDAELDTLDFAKYQAAINALDTLDGQTGASEPETMVESEKNDLSLQNLINDAINHEEHLVKLDKDYTISEPLTISGTVTLDLNGHVIKTDRGDGNFRVKSSVIKVESGGNLTLRDSNPSATHDDTSLPNGGVITGGTNGYPPSGTGSIEGGGVYNEGTFSMCGGTIYNCKPEWHTLTSYGGGIYNKGTLSMSGGSIQNCSANYGAAVHNYSGSSFTMSGTAEVQASVWLGYSATMYANGGTIGDKLTLEGTSTLTRNASGEGADTYTTFNGKVEGGGTIEDTAKLTVTFDSTGGSVVLAGKVLKGKTVGQPDDPTKEGCNFLGWYDSEGNKYDFSTLVTDHLTLYAAWDEIITVKVPYTTTVKQGDNTAPGEMTFDLEVVDQYGNPAEEYADVTISGSVETTGAGEFKSNLTMKGTKSALDGLESFLVRQKQGSEANWTYDNAVYCVQRVWEQDEPSTLSTEDDASIEFEIHPTAVVDKAYTPLEGNPVDMKFVNVYTLHTHVHSYSQQYNESQHWEECDCGDKQSEELHQFGEWVVTKEATETEEGAQERTCAVCPYKQTEIIPMLPHTHQYDQQFDADSHWMECPCGDIQELEEHQFGEWVVTREPTTDELGEQERVCSVCGYSETEDLPALVEDESSNNSSNSNKTGSTKTTSAKTGSPKTGDEMSLSTMVAALVLSGAAIIALVVTGKKYANTSNR